MAPRNARNTTAGPSGSQDTDTQPNTPVDTPQEAPTAATTILAQQAEIDRLNNQLNALLQAQATLATQPVTTLAESIV
jgi:hypothetical protein